MKLNFVPILQRVRTPVTIPWLGAGSLSLTFGGFRIMISTECQGGPEVGLVIHEVCVTLVGVRPGTHHEVVLAESSCPEYTIENVEAMIKEVIGCVTPDVSVPLPVWTPRVWVRVCSSEGLRSCLNLSAPVVAFMATAGASLDFDPETALECAEEGFVDGMDATCGGALKSELVVLLVGDSPESGQESVISKVTRQWYTTAEACASIAEVIDLGRQRVGEDLERWGPQVGIRLASLRGMRPALFIPSQLIGALAACRASLDFDPYV